MIQNIFCPPVRKLCSLFSLSELFRDSVILLYNGKSVLDFYSAAALLVMRSTVLATVIPSVSPSVRHTLVLYPDE